MPKVYVAGGKLSTFAVVAGLQASCTPRPENKRRITKDNNKGES
jgi:hypothetical protein